MKTQTKILLTSLLILIVSWAFFAFLQNKPVFADPDSFYHTKIAVMMSQGQVVIKSFPWIQFAPFTQNFTDHHFLYHLLLIPFVKIFPPALGAKIFTVFLAGLAFLFFYSFSRRWLKTPWLPALGLIFLLTAPSFIFRMSLTKTSSISLIILLIALSLLWQKRYKTLSLLSFFYVWTYGGWSMILILLASHLLSQIITNKKITDWKTPIAILAGCLAGLVINPYFPHNILFYWEQMIQIGMVNYQSIIPVGQEWYPFAPLDLLANLAFIFILALSAFVIFLWRVSTTSNNTNRVFCSEDCLSHPQGGEFRNKKNPNGVVAMSAFQKIFTLFIFSGILLVLTIKSQRFIEYSVPFFILANLFLLDLVTPPWPKIKNYLLSLKSRDKKLFSFVAAYLVLSLLAVIVMKNWEIHDLLNKRFTWNYLQGASTWLAQNTPDKSLVYHTGWSDFPMLFFHNDHNTYIVGLDPTFFYRYNPELYKKWYAINRGEIKDGLAQTIKKKFNTNFLLLKEEDKELQKIIPNNPDFILRYSDSEAKVYEIK